MRAGVLAVVMAVTLACAPRTPVVSTPRITPQELAVRLAEADRLVSRGCYLCLKEAAAAYSALLALSDDPAVARKALENNLMLVMREFELRMPDSGAREAADDLRTRIPGYEGSFEALDLLPPPPLPNSVAFVGLRNERGALLKLASSLETDAQASAMRAYFYLSVALRALPREEIQPRIESLLAAHPGDLSLKYQRLGFQPMFSTESARELIGMETGFGEVHFLLGQRAVMGGNLADAFRELSRARQLLPDSASITLALADVSFSYARYSDALALYDQVAGAAASGLVPEARLGRARALSYLKRHAEAIALLDELLQQDAQNNPGEKYYWRSWNRLQAGESQLAYNDATTGLNAMRNDAIYRLAGIAAFNLERLDEARGFFEQALDINRADCDSTRYLGLLDSARRNWQPAGGRFSQAAACYNEALRRLAAELAEYENDITGLSTGLITAKRAEIKEAEALRANAVQNAAAAAKYAGQPASK